MSTTASTQKSDEFVVYGEEPLPLSPSDDKASSKTFRTLDFNAENPLSLDTVVPPRTDSFPKSLPLPASSILSPTSAAQKSELPTLSEAQNRLDSVVSPPEISKMLIQESNLSPAEEEARASTPLAELAGTMFDQEVAVRRRGASIVGEEISENLKDLKVEDEEPTLTTKKSPPETLDMEALQARKNDPAVLAALPQTPSAEDFEVARSHEGTNFNPEFGTETQVAS